MLSQLVEIASLRLYFWGTVVLFEQQLGLPRRGYSMHPVDTLRSLVAKLEDVPVLLPHPAMGDYRCMVVSPPVKLIVSSS